MQLPQLQMQTTFTVKNRNVAIIQTSLLEPPHTALDNQLATTLLEPLVYRNSRSNSRSARAHLSNLALLAAHSRTYCRGLWSQYNSDLCPTHNISEPVEGPNDGISLPFNRCPGSLRTRKLLAGKSQGLLHPSLIQLPQRGPNRTTTGISVESIMPTQLRYAQNMCTAHLITQQLKCTLLLILPW